MDNYNVIDIPEDLDSLEEDYNNWLDLPFDSRKASNSICIKKYGCTNEQLYQIIKDKLTNTSINEQESEIPLKQYLFRNKRILRESTDSNVPSVEDRELIEYRNTIRNESNDYVMSNIRAIDCLEESDNRTNYESYILENFGDTININGHNYRQDMPGVMPFLTYYEYLHNTKSLDQRKIHARNPFVYVLNRINNRKNIEAAYANHDNEALIEMGWNPYVEPNTESFKYARERQIDFFNEYYGFNICDISKFHTSKAEELLEVSNDVTYNTKLQPIFIVLISSTYKPDKITNKKYTYNDFSKIGLSLDSSLDSVYFYRLGTTTTTDKKYTFALNTTAEINSIKELEKVDITKDNELTAKSLHILTFFVTPRVKAAIKNGIKFYIKNQTTGDQFDSIISVVNDKYKKDISFGLHILVAQFIDSIFRISSIYNKNDLRLVKYKENSNIYIIYNGTVSGYKKNKVDSNIAWLQKNGNRDSMNFFDTKNPDGDNIDFYDFDSYIQKYSFVNTVDGVKLEYYNAVQNMYDILTPTSIITESILDPGVVLSADNIFNSYKNSIEVLAQYDSSNIEGIKKEAKELFILYSICDSLIKQSSAEPDIDRLVPIKLSIEKAMNFYINVIKQEEANFNIKEYSDLKINGKSVDKFHWKNRVLKYDTSSFKYTPIK